MSDDDQQLEHIPKSQLTCPKCRKQIDYDAMKLHLEVCQVLDPEEISRRIDEYIESSPKF